MAQVPTGYQPESGFSRCGGSWRASVTVTGEIPGTDGFGADRTRLLKGIVETGVRYGWGTDEESGFAQDLRALIDDGRERLNLDSHLFSAQEYASVRWLLDHADAELSSSQKLYDKWLYRPGGPFPLDLEDTPDAMWDACDSIPHGDHDPQWVETPGRAADQKCPTSQDLQQRTRDRAQIANRYRDAARHIRCARWGMWRIILYKQALADYQPPFDPGLTAPGAPTPTPGIAGPGDLGVYTPPPFPPDWEPPPPHRLPPADQVPTEAEFVPLQREAVPKDPSKKLVIPILVGGALAAWLLPKFMRSR